MLFRQPRIMLGWAVLSLLPAMVSAHGYLSQVTIAGKVYQGPSPGSSGGQSSIIRQVASNSPVKGATNPDLNCGLSAQPAGQSASANPGDELDIQWVGGTTPTGNAVRDFLPCFWITNTQSSSSVASQCWAGYALYGKV